MNLVSRPQDPRIGQSARSDWYVLREIEDIVKDKLRDALAVVGTKVIELDYLDPDAVMSEVRKYFCPTGPHQQDNFSDALWSFKNECEDAGGVPSVSEPMSIAAE